MLKKILTFLFALTFTFAFAEQKCSVVVLGGGISGLSSGIYLARSGLKTIIIEGQTSSLITQAHAVENWPAEKTISGSRLIEKLKEQAIASGCTILSKDALKVDFSKRPFVIEVAGLSLNSPSETVVADNCLITMGCQSKHLNIEGEKEYWSRGVSACALCDGTLYKDKTVAVVGGSRAALLESSYLSNLAKKVYVIVRSDGFRKTVEPKQKEALLAKDNVEVIYNTKIEKILGNGTNLEKVLLSNGKELLIDGLFTAVGLKPNTELFSTSKELSLDEKGFIKVKEGHQTSIEGVYAAGDIIVGQEKQAILAAASGVKAALSIEQNSFLEKKVLPVENVAINTAEKITQSVKITETKALKLLPQKEVNFEIKALSEIKSDIPALEVKVLKAATTVAAEQKMSEQSPVSVIKNAKVQIIEIKNKDHLERELKNSTTPVIVDFYATWCGPCQKIGPLLEELPANNVKLLKVNVDVCAAIAREYKIMAMPTAILFSPEGNILSTKIGFHEINSLIHEFSAEQTLKPVQ